MRLCIRPSPLFTAPSDGALERDMGTNYPRSGRLRDLCTGEFVESVEDESEVPTLHIVCCVMCAC